MKNILISKQWFIYVLTLIGIIGIFALFVLLCGIFNANVDELLSLLIFGGFCFVAGMIFENFL